MAIPAVLFAAVLVGVVAVALSKTPQKQKWLLPREYEAWRPALTADGEQVTADARFLFERSVGQAELPRARHRTGELLGPDGEVRAACLSRVVSVTKDAVITEFRSESGVERITYQGLSTVTVGAGMIVQRGDWLGGVKDPAGFKFQVEGGGYNALPVADWPAPEIRTFHSEVPELGFNLPDPVAPETAEAEE